MLREPDLTPAPKTLDWTCVNLGRGEKVVGVLCGRVRKFLCHHTSAGESKPCLSYATDGALTCWCESRPSSIRPVVYVPVVLRDGAQIVVRMSAVQGYKAEKIRPGALVEFSRPDKTKRPTFIAQLVGTAATQDWVLKHQKDCDRDILEFLCHLWQLHALTRHCGFTPRRSVKAASKIDLSDPDCAPRFSFADKVKAERPTDEEGN